jgi:bifunctional non-homologous end joining protein LigD
MSLRSRPGSRFPGFIEPALPCARGLPPSGSGWIHEIKFDGFRLLARRDGPQVRLFTRNGYDWTDRFPLIRAGMTALTAHSCLIDGEAVCCEVDGVPSFELLRYRHHDSAVFLYAFDLLELDGRDLRPAPLEERRAALARLLRQVKSSVHLSDHVEADGPIVFRHACALGVKALSPSARARPIAQAGRWIGSKSRTLRHPRPNAMPKGSTGDGRALRIIFGGGVRGWNGELVGFPAAD